MSDTRQIVDRYFDALQRKDFEAMRPTLRDDITFSGPMGTTSGIDEYVTSLQRLTASMTSAARHHVWTDGDDACQIYDLIFPHATVPVAQWLTLREGRIATARVYCDVRPLLPPS